MVVLDTTGWLWINRVDDPSMGWRFQFLTGLGSQPVTAFSNDVMAGGNLQFTVGPGRQSTVTVALTACTPEDRQLWEFELLGVPVWVRDDRARKFAAYHDPPQVTEHSYNDECDIGLTFHELTAVEAV